MSEVKTEERKGGFGRGGGKFVFLYTHQYVCVLTFNSSDD